MVTCAKDQILSKVNDVAEIHYFIRPFLISSLQSQIINPDAVNGSQSLKETLKGSKTYYEFWDNRHGPSFFDMMTIIRLGSVVEIGLRDYYLEKKCYQSLLDLQNDQNCRGIFQRVFDQNNSVTSLYQTQLSYNLTSNVNFPLIKELMAYRHCFAHNNGVVDEKFIKNYKEATKVDLTTEMQKLGYPALDIYRFISKEEVTKLIESSRRFFNSLP